MEMYGAFDVWGCLFAGVVVAVVGVAVVGMAGVGLAGVDVAEDGVAGGRAMAIRGRRGRRGNGHEGTFVGVGWLGRARAESARNAVRV